MRIQLKEILCTLLFFTLLSAIYSQNTGACFPDKGIKIAKTFAQIKGANTSNDSSEVGIREAQYDLEGRPILIRENQNESKYTRIFAEEKLQLIITTHKDLPDFYLAEEYDSLVANAKEVKDTTIVVKHFADGQQAEVKDANGLTWIFEYKGCTEELQTLIGSDGDTLHQYHLMYKNGALVETCWTLFDSTKSTLVTKYFGYKFNKQGHWIKRKYRRKEGMIEENRTLTYY